jgi:hypothetical protein
VPFFNAWYTVGTQKAQKVKNHKLSSLNFIYKGFRCVTQKWYLIPKNIKDVTQTEENEISKEAEFKRIKDKFGGS